MKSIIEINSININFQLINPTAELHSSETITTVQTNRIYKQIPHFMKHSQDFDKAGAQ
jgi:hypothetical protein